MTTARMLTLLEAVGPARGTARWLQAALGRVPLEGTAGLSWRDRVPLRPHLPWMLRPLYDLAQPFLGSLGIEMRYRLERVGETVVVLGESAPSLWLPRLQTEARLPAGPGQRGIVVRVGRTLSAVSERAARVRRSLVPERTTLTPRGSL